MRTPDENVEEWETQLRRGYLEVAILASLWNEPLYALEILRYLEKSGGGLTVTEGTIYPLLSRLRADETLKSTWIESELGHPRRYYELTPKGRRRLLMMEERWTAHSRVLNSVLQSVRRTKRKTTHAR